MALFGESDEVKAVRLANEANYNIQSETNWINQEIAEHSNQWNWANLQAQNEWNIQQWERENDYNSPSKQVERYMKAGLNPLWAIANGNPGNSAHLESGTPQPAATVPWESVMMAPEIDPNRGAKLQSLISAATNVSNTGLGFYKALLEKEDVATRKSAQKSLENLQKADIAYRRAQTVGQDLYNNLNRDTYGSIVKTKALEADELQGRINLLQKQGHKTDAEIANLKELNKQIIAQTDYTNTLNNAKVQEVLQGWRKLAIDQQNANTNYFQAQTDLYQAQSENVWQGLNFGISAQRFRADTFFRQKELEMRSSEDLMKLYSENKGWLERNITGNAGLIIDRAFGSNVDGGSVSSSSIIGRLETIQDIGNILNERVSKDPSRYNVEVFDEFSKGLNSLPEAPKMPPTLFAPGQSVLNSSQSWQ